MRACEFASFQNNKVPLQKKNTEYRAGVPPPRKKSEKHRAPTIIMDRTESPERNRSSNKGQDVAGRKITRSYDNRELLFSETLLDQFGEAGPNPWHSRSESTSGRYHGGLLTARSQPPWQSRSTGSPTTRLKLAVNLSDALPRIGCCPGHSFPAFEGCPEWIKPLIYQDCQV